MLKKTIFILIIFSFFSCKKKNIDCDKKFGDLYLKRYSLWMAFDRINIQSNDNFSREEYQKLRKQTNDSLQMMIDCAIMQNKNNEILYLYKMKQLFLCDKKEEIAAFFKTIDRKIVKDDMYFQMNLYSVLCEELSTKKAPIEKYKILLKTYSPKLNPVYKDRAFKEFLTYLINDDYQEFNKSLEDKYPDVTSVLLNENEREKIIKDIIMRGDFLIFD